MRVAHKPTPTPTFAPNAAAGTLTVNLQKGPFQNNGATPWSAPIGIGTPGQTLNIALDSGSNFVWVTSSLCETSAKGCAHWGGGEFKYQNSTSFTWISQTQQSVSFGPWGSMTVETGSDLFDFPGGDNVRVPLYLAAEYSGTQFQELDWDGGIGLPSSSANVESGMSFFFGQMVADGYVRPDCPFFTYQTDPSTKTGQVIFGGFDPSAADLNSWIFLPFAPYTALAGVEYIWTSPLAAYTVDGHFTVTGKSFCLDSGSSQFKGDDTIMANTLAAIPATGTKPNIILEVGNAPGGATGQLIVTPDIYEVLIEAGEGQGTVVPQFAGLGCPDLVLVGSILMDQLVTVYEYSFDGTSYTPVGMHLFNKANGPKIIQNGGAAPQELLDFLAGSRNLTGKWENAYGSLMTLEQTDAGFVFGEYSSTTGSTGVYRVMGFANPDTASATEGQNVALSLFWRSIAGGQGDPSWHYVSGFAGQVEAGHNDQLQLIHAFVATADFPGLCQPGTYLGQLEYIRQNTTPWAGASFEGTRTRPTVPQKGAQTTDDPINGIWTCTQDPSILMSLAALEGDTGFVWGEIAIGGDYVLLFGFTDTYATADGIALQSLSVSGFSSLNDVAVNLAGRLDLASGNLSLLRMDGLQTSFGNSYVQTGARGLDFTKG